ncbi:hypothetical protein [Aureibacter tunicatorum]|uniref:Lipoprotein n=1 Tax=Aureibacter tunicatorum TaxID=866807 RepID=A0AAE4BTM8_9BACT|nr:hypothetical protein [Aureibacter tunicatorum]MDR6240851.1 hypothetical protein [Aureibacter tunicatorum]BDD06816.1 hypothetical protein AUTU_42990 [Aureibacter tunicatorum]
MRIKLLGIVFFLIGCGNSSDYEGDWRVKSKHYQSIIRISERNGKLEAELLEYDDGTQVLLSTEARPLYMFKELEVRRSSSMDAMTGATGKGEFDLRLLHADTLLISQNTYNKKLTEIWLKVK